MYMKKRLPKNKGGQNGYNRSSYIGKEVPADKDKISNHKNSRLSILP